MVHFPLSPGGIGLRLFSLQEDKPGDQQGYSLFVIRDAIPGGIVALFFPA
jgi:hypothetical protein